MSSSIPVNANTAAPAGNDADENSPPIALSRVTRNSPNCEPKAKTRAGTKQAVTRRSATLKKMNAEHRAWKPTPEEQALDNDWYDATIAPRLHEVSVRSIQIGLGVSDGGASKIRRGVYRPHKRHWLPLHQLILSNSGETS